LFGLPATTDPALKLGRFFEGALLLLQYVHDVERIRQNVRNLFVRKITGCSLDFEPKPVNRPIAVSQYQLHG
jgi:hypothetical protein